MSPVVQAVDESLVSKRAYVRQVNQLKAMLDTPSWAFLMTQWRLALDATLKEMEKAKAEGPWQFSRGKLTGYRECIHTIDELLSDVKQVEQEIELEENYE